MYQSHIFLIHSAADGYLGWLRKLALVTSAAVRMDVQGTLRCLASESFGEMRRSGITGSYGRLTWLFRDLRTDFHSSCSYVPSSSA